MKKLKKDKRFMQSLRNVRLDSDCTYNPRFGVSNVLPENTEYLKYLDSNLYWNDVRVAAMESEFSKSYSSMYLKPEQTFTDIVQTEAECAEYVEQFILKLIKSGHQEVYCRICSNVGISSEVENNFYLDFCRASRYNPFLNFYIWIFRDLGFSSCVLKDGGLVLHLPDDYLKKKVIPFLKLYKLPEGLQSEIYEALLGVKNDFFKRELEGYNAVLHKDRHLEKGFMSVQDSVGIFTNAKHHFVDDIKYEEDGDLDNSSLRLGYLEDNDGAGGSSFNTSPTLNSINLTLKDLSSPELANFVLNEGITGESEIIQFLEEEGCLEYQILDVLGILKLSGVLL